MTDADPLLAKTIRIGRRPDNDIIVSDLGVAKQHAKSVATPAGSFEIIILGSLAGTFVLDDRIAREIC